LIDDDEDYRFFAQQAVEFAGHRSEGFPNSRDALTMLGTALELPEIVMMDYQMPGLSAADFIGEVRREARWRGTRLLLVSGIADVARVAGEIGADGFLAKPFDLAMVEKVLSAHLAAS